MDVVEYVKATLWLIGSLSAVAVAYENVYVKPKERKRKRELRRTEELRNEERKALVEIRKKEYEELLLTIENTFNPYIERGERTKKRVGYLEGVVDEHDSRIATLEKDKDGNFQYKEQQRR